MQKMTNEETNHRLAILSSILYCPHRDIDKILEVHQDAQKADPLFYTKLAIWHKKNGEIRDHNEAFTGLLCTDSILEHRETGLALLRELPAYLKDRVKGLIKGKTIKIRHKLDTKIKNRRNKFVNKVNIEKKVIGLKRNLPRSFVTEILQYLHWLEADPKRFDETALKNFDALQGLYASLGVKMKSGATKRAGEILFEGKIPEDSPLRIIKEILAAKTPAEKAELIVKNKIPYTTAVGLIKKMTPSILTALISVMTPQEVMNNVSSLKERGAYDNEDVKNLVLSKLEQAKFKKGTAVLKSKVAKEAAKTDDAEINAKLDSIADEGIKKTAIIKLPTGIIIDKSGSLEKTIEVGKQTASMISGATEAPLYVIATDEMAREIKANGKTLTDWELAFKTITANGATSLGAGVDFLRRQKYFVEQIIIVTDEQENRGPLIGEALKAYRNELGIMPYVVIVKVEASLPNSYEAAMFRKGVKEATGDYTVFEIQTDTKGYYALPSLIPLLSKKSKLDLLYEIMDMPLLTRKPFEERKRSGNR